MESSQPEFTPFTPTGLGQTIFQERYARQPEETFAEASRRVSDHVAEAEENGKMAVYADRFYEQIAGNRFMPGGRIWYGAGRPKAQLLNCVAGDTDVHTERGLAKARDLVDQEVRILTDGGAYRSAKWYSYGQQELFQVRLSNGDELYATAQHEWVVTNGPRVTTEDLAGRQIPLEWSGRLEAPDRPTIEVESVRRTDRIEEVFCCVEPETHTMVIGAGYLTGQCFVLPTADSREGWGKTISDVIVVSGLGGGVGINASPVRPRGSDIHGTGGKATGAVSLMQMIDRVGDVLVGGGGRRMALMLCLDLNHPDLEEFLNVKLDLDQLTNANVSIVVNTDTDEFARKIKNDEQIEFEFGGRPTGTMISAKELWHKLVENAWKSGEPGILNGYLANKMNNIWYHRRLISTNPCGEIWLEKYGCCDLGALVLPRFICDGEMDWDALDESVRLGVRFLDNVLSVNYYPLKEIQDNCERVRRIGLGVMGLHTMLLQLGLRYSSDEGRAFVDRLFSFIKNTAYDASINLAIEKGPFPVYDPKFLQSGFAKTLKRGIRNKVKEHGIRNCALLTIAPTGTTSMVAGVTSGIEPVVAPVYWRNYFSMDEKAQRLRKRELVVSPEYQHHPDLVEGAADLHPRDHFEIQAVVQRHIDNAVSKTINLPADYPVDELAEIWLEYLPLMKGSTFYRWGSRENEPLSPIPTAEAMQVIEEQQGKVVYEGFTDEGDDMLSCPGGVCEV